MATINQDQAETSEPQPPLLDYACTQWRASSQSVADLYHSGAKLWKKSDLEDIERQLEQSYDLDRFTLRAMDGKEVQIKNPMFGVERPIWRPYVKFYDYWSLTLTRPTEKPERPAELSHCSYNISWGNTVDHDFRGDIEDWQDLYETRRQLWNASITCKLLKAKLSKLLFEGQQLHSRKISKVLCFALGDFALTHYFQGDSSPDANSARPMTQHLMALTIAAEIRKYNPDVRLITQDPQYRDCTASFLREKGFEVKGRFGASAFAELDDESLVITAYPAAPIRQIVADFARPAMIISTYWDHRRTMNSDNKPFIDVDSPRTKEMWLAYDKCELPTAEVEHDLMEGVRNLFIFARKDSTVLPFS
ncbi:unnamed protein product [Clonostachys rhizophaga]|uniref:SRR1-like domain-containing protein n=1 Tax=Clonostachys rhizophaga TaxID=160324 RepID=A0A9N9W1S6_9HYPO|nr:unnamed protein product [Clonostachys rhizophaga]